jgi:hypothetical protein
MGWDGFVKFIVGLKMIRRYDRVYMRLGLGIISIALARFQSP